MNTQDNNKLIAEFMEFPTQTDEVDDRTLAYYIGSVINANNENNENEDNVFHPDDMQFHNSWDWLMPVVEKIESLGYDTELVNRLDEGGNFFCINDSVVPQTYAETKIEATYNAVVEFIKDYNK